MSTVHDAADQQPDESDERARRILASLSFCGRYLHFHRGGHSGKAPIICLLARNGGTMSQQELGRSLELKPGSLSEILAKIETAGLIERTRDERDRRQLFVHLTERGFHQAELDQASRERFRQDAFTCLTVQEQEDLVSMLEKIRHRWEELND